MPNNSTASAKKRKTRHSGYVFRMSRQGPGSTQLGLAKYGLLSLVDELLLICIDHIEGSWELASLSATCTRLQDLVEPYIWRSLLVLSGTHAHKISTALDSRIERLDFVQEISIRYKDEAKQGIEELNHHIAEMKRLRHLHIESPCPNNSEWRTGLYFDGYSRIDYTNLLASAVYPRIGLHLTLPALQSLTLHGHGPEDRKFLLGRAKAMFFHPTLRTIVLSCLNFEADMTLDEDLVTEKHKSTPLQSLTLIECNVDVRFLDVVLSLPKALRELSIGERLHRFPECEPCMDPKRRTSSPLFLKALQRQASSLRRLHHIGGLIECQPPRETDPEGAAKLRSLACLESLELGFESHLYYYLRNKGFPPQLKTLKMLDAAISLNAGHDLRAMSDIAFRSLMSLVMECLPSSLQADFTLHLHFSDHSIFRLFVIAHPAEQNYLLSQLFLDRPSIYKIATILESYHAKFHVSRETFPGGTGYIPPYMYGEEVPVDETMYDSNDYWRFSGIDYQIMDDDRLRDELKGKSMLRTCVRCSAQGLSLEECRNLGDSSPCLPCRRARADCAWSGNGSSGEDDQDTITFTDSQSN